MDISLKELEEALSIRRQVDTLERRLSSILGIASSLSPPKGRRGMSAATRAKLSAVAKARWAKRKRTGVSEAVRKKGTSDEVYRPAVGRVCDRPDMASTTSILRALLLPSGPHQI